MKEKKIPLRKCIGCYEMKPKSELIRIVSPKESEVSLDLCGKAAGRGAYLCRSAECFAKAKKAHKLEKEFSRKISPEVYELLEKQLTEASK